MTLCFAVPRVPINPGHIDKCILSPSAGEVLPGAGLHMREVTFGAQTWTCLSVVCLSAECRGDEAFLAWEAFCLQRVVGAPQFKYFSSRKMAMDSPCH